MQIVSMSTRYRHTQWGWVIIVSTVPIALLVLGIAVATGQPLFVGTIGALILGTSLLFGALTVSIDEKELIARFGVGLIKKRVALADVRAASAVTNPWYYGWGLRMYPGGMLYNVSGADAVELHLRDGSQCRIGTDEPNELLKAIVAATGPLAPMTTAELAQSRQHAKKWGIVMAALAFGIVAGVGALLAVQSRAPGVRVDARGLTVDAPFYGVTVPVADMKVVTLEDHLPPIRMRTNGFAMGETLRGWFRVEGMGEGKIFVEAKHPPYVMVKHASGFVIVNVADANETRAIYERIREVAPSATLPAR